jgi:hypothetical protein
MDPAAREQAAIFLDELIDLGIARPSDPADPANTAPAFCFSWLGEKKPEQSRKESTHKSS